MKCQQITLFLLLILSFTGLSFSMDCPNFLANGLGIKRLDMSGAVEIKQGKQPTVEEISYADEQRSKKNRFLKGELVIVKSPAFGKEYNYGLDNPKKYVYGSVVKSGIPSSDPKIQYCIVDIGKAQVKYVKKEIGKLKMGIHCVTYEECERLNLNENLGTEKADGSEKKGKERELSDDEECEPLIEELEELQDSREGKEKDLNEFRERIIFRLRKKLNTIKGDLAQVNKCDPDEFSEEEILKKREVLLQRVSGFNGLIYKLEKLINERREKKPSITVIENSQKPSLWPAGEQPPLKFVKKAKNWRQSDNEFETNEIVIIKRPKCEQADYTPIKNASDYVIGRIEGQAHLKQISQEDEMHWRIDVGSTCCVNTVFYFGSDIGKLTDRDKVALIKRLERS